MYSTYLSCIYPLMCPMYMYIYSEVCMFLYRLMESHKRMQKINNNLENKLLNMVKYLIIVNLDTCI